MAGTGLIELRRIEAAKEIAAELSRSPNVAYIPAGDNGKMLLGLNAAGFGR
jgi:prohibitin 1